MKDYQIDALYDEGFINGEVYYLCDENGISCLSDAVKFFNDPNPPDYIESLHRVYIELSEDSPQWGNDSSKESLQQREPVLIQNEALLVQLFRESLKKHSVRANNAIRVVKQEYGSYSDFFKWLLSPAFNPLQIKNVGAKTALELKEWQSEIQDYFNCHQPHNNEPEEFVDNGVSGSGFAQEENAYFQNEALFRQLFNESLNIYSVRAYHAIKSVREEYNSYTEFFNWVLSPDFNPMRLKNVGRKTYKELLEWKAYIQQYLFTHQRFLIKEHHEAPEEDVKERDNSAAESTLLQNETLLKELFYDSLNGCSVRASNALKVMKAECGSFASFFKWVLSDEFVPIQLKNVGRKTVAELKEWKTGILYTFFTEQSSGDSDLLIKAKEDKTCPAIPTLDKNALFDSIFGFIDSLNDSRRALLYYLAEKNVGDGLSTIAKGINLSRERVRQLIPRVLIELGKFLKSKRKYFDYTKDEYLHLADQCGHSLNKEFVIWVGAQVSSEIVLIGAYKDYICKGKLFMMTDAYLAAVFDFNLFIQKIESLAENKYYKETRIIIEDIVLDCFRKDVQFELLPTIVRSCRTILYEQYPYHLSEKEIIIPANSYYSIRQRVEDILAEEGIALSIGQIRERLEQSGAGYEGTDNQLVAMIRKSNVIVAYGYPCKYGLTIWGKPEEEAYDSIRDAAIRILLEHNPHILTEKRLVSALLSVFTESSERSILSNLMADSKQRFGTYLKGKERYIGLTKEIYDSAFILQVKRDTKKAPSSSHARLSWQGTFDSVKKVLSTHSWTALDDQQRKWLISNWKKANSGTLKEWQSTQILELVETSKKK